MEKQKTKTKPYVLKYNNQMISIDINKNNVNKSTIICVAIICFGQYI